MSKHRARNKSKTQPRTQEKNLAEPSASVVASSDVPLNTARQPGRWIGALISCLLAVLCAGLYAWTADFPMVFDDEMYLKNNPLFKDAASFSYPAHFAEFASRPAKIGMDPDMATNFILRPVAYATFRLNYLLDGFNPRWFRVLNIVIHAANSILIYALLGLLLRQSPHAGTLPRGSAIFIPATVALLFAAHPLATESVTYIVQRFTSMSTLFYLLTLWLYFSSLRATTRTGGWALRISAVLPLVLGMLTKECVFTAPFMAVLIDHLINGTRLRAAAFRALPLLLCLPIIPMLVLLTSAAQHHGTFDLTTAINIANSRDNPLNHWHYIVTQFTVVATYLRRVFWPTGLNLDPEWPLHRSLVEAPVLLALAVLATLIAAAGWMWRRHRCDARASLAFVFTLWFFVTVAVSSGLVPLPDLMADHRSYLPSIGILVLVACLLDALRNSNWRPLITRSLIPVITIIYTVALAWATCVRNEVWRTTESLWKDAVAKSPGKFRTWGNLGQAYSASGKEDEAVNCYRKSLAIEPRFQYSRFNLSNSLLRLGRPKESLDESLLLIKMDEKAATKPLVVYTVGLGLAGVGRYEEAASIFKDILAAIPNDARSHQALGMVYLRTSRAQLALEHFQQAASLQQPDENLLASIRQAEEALAQSTPRPASPLPFRLR